MSQARFSFLEGYGFKSLTEITITENETLMPYSNETLNLTHNELSLGNVKTVCWEHNNMIM